MTHRILRFAHGLAVALALGLAGPAMAAESTGSGTEPGQSTEVSPGQLEQFAAAQVDIQAVQAEYVPKLQQAGSKADQRRLQKDGQQKMVDAIRSTGLKLAEYQEIGRQLNQNKELQKRFKRVMKEQQGTAEQGGSR